MKVERSNPNKQIQRERTIQYYIEAAIKIIEKEGMSAVTIRKVSDLAGYNSATLYNYFDNLQHLLFFASMTYLDEYIDDIPLYIKYAENAEDVYLQDWRCFLDHAFLRPEIYNTLFFSELKGDVDSYASQYYALYPLDIKKYSPEIRRMLNTGTLEERNKVLITDCVKEGFVEEEAVTPITTLSSCVLESMLARTLKRKLTAGIAKEQCEYYIRMAYFGLKNRKNLANYSSYMPLDR